METKTEFEVVWLETDEERVIKQEEVDHPEEDGQLHQKLMECQYEIIHEEHSEKGYIDSNTRTADVNCSPSTSPPMRRKHIYVGHLSVEEKQNVVTLYNELSKTLKKSHAVYKIMHDLGLAKATVYRTLKEFKTTGTVAASVRCGGRPPLAPRPDKYKNTAPDEDSDEMPDYFQEVFTNNKVKNRKQHYRNEWEQMDDFKGWLQGVAQEPSRAYCKFCEKNLDAHRLTLLKHRATMKHQRAAQVQQNNINVETQEESGTENENEARIGKKITIFSSSDIKEHKAHQHKNGEKCNVSVVSRNPFISTRVLDISEGQPVSGLHVSLYRLVEGCWIHVSEGFTGAQGRFSNFFPREDSTPGRYKLHYDVDKYFEAREQDSLYPFVEIVCDCRASVDHYHIRLLVGPFSYTTYYSA